jgi:hypothetical protein
MRADNEPVLGGGSVVDKSVNLINSNARIVFEESRSGARL